MKSPSKIVFIARVSKAGRKLYIAIPRKIHPSISHGKVYVVTLEEAEQK